MNPIRYSDFFDGSDRQEILLAIQDMRALKDSVKEFNSTVTGAHGNKMDAQMASLAREIQGVAAASRELNITNDQSQKALAANLQLVTKLRAENEALRKSKEGARQSEDALAGSVDGLNKKLRDLVKAYRAVDQSTEGGHVRAEKYAASIRKTREEIKGLEAATKSTTAVVRAAAGSYNELDQQTKALVKDYKALADMEGVNKEKAAALSKQIHENTTRLKAYDEQLNQNFRNVGNYKSAFNAVGGSINQLTRELPAFTNSVQTGFLAISNNLPIFADALGNAAAKNRELKAEGQATVPVWQQLIKGIFSWQTALSLGITLLTIYGKEIGNWFAHLFKANKGLEQMKENIVLVNQVQAEARKSAGEEISKLKILYTTATDVTKSMEERTRAVKALKAEYPDYFGKLSNEIIMNGKAKDSYDKLYDSIIKTARATAAASKLGELEAQRLQAEEQKLKIITATDKEQAKVKAPIKTALQFGGDKFETQDIRKQGADVITIEEQRAQIQKRRLAALDLEDKKITSINAKEKFLVDFVGANNLVKVSGGSDDDIKKFDEQALKDAEDAAKKLEAAIRKQDELIQASAKLRIAEAEKAFAVSAQRAEDEIKLEEERRAIIVETTGLRAKLYAKGTKEQKDILAEQLAAETDYIEKVRVIRDKDAAARTNLLIKAAETDFNKTKKGWTDELDFEQKRLQILQNGFAERMALYAKDSDEYKALLADKTAAEAAAALRTKQIREQQDAARTGAQQADVDLSTTRKTFHIKKQEARGQITPEDAERQLHLMRVGNLEEQIAAKKKTLETLKEGDADYYEHLKALSQLEKELVAENGQYEIDQEKKVQDAKKALRQAAFDFAVTSAGALFDIGRELNEGNIAALERDKQRELSIAGNNVAARRQIEENYAKEQTKLKRKQAIADKAQALFNIAISTAQGVAAALANPFTAPFMIPFIIATGALQAAVVLARPLPQYKKGRGRTGVREMAETNEDGYELIEDAQGRYRIANKGRRGVTEVNPQEKIYTHQQSKRMVDEVINTEDGMAYMRSMLRGVDVMDKHQQKREERLVQAIVAGQLSEQVLGRAVARAVAQLPSERWEVNEKGARKYVETLGGRTQSLNSRNQLGENG